MDTVQLVEMGWARHLDPPEPDAGEVHLWRLDLETREPGAASAESLLSRDERGRAERLRISAARLRWIAARGGLRQLLGRYLATEPSDIRFTYGQLGKPHLAGASAPPLRFNLSHSDGIALIAVTLQREVGVDVERVRADFPHLRVARRVFSPEDAASLGTIPPGELPRAFFTAWVHREACLKAHGLGVWAGGDETGCLWTRNLSPADGYVGALAVL